MLARFNADGTPDLSWGNGDGIKSEDELRLPPLRSLQLAVRPDGLIAVAGSGDLSTVGDDDLDHAVALLSPDGVVDLGFGGFLDGVAGFEDPFGGSTDRTGDLAFSDDKPLVVGQDEQRLYRLTLNGQFDPGFVGHDSAVFIDDAPSDDHR